MPFKVGQRVFFREGTYGYTLITVLKVLHVDNKRQEPEYNCQWGEGRADFFEFELFSIKQKWKLFKQEEQRKKWKWRSK